MEPDFRYNSFWVFSEIISAVEYVDYITGKVQTLNRPMEVADFSGTEIDEHKGYVAGVMIRSLTDEVLYRSRSATVKFMGLEAVGK